MSEIAAALIKDVPRYDPCNCGGATVPDGHLVTYPDVLAALTTALDPALAERAGEVLPRLRKADEYEPLGYDGWEAADLITALLAQNGALRKERDELAEALKVNNAVLCDALLRNVAAEAEVEKLTGAGDGLHSIVEGIQGAMQHGTWRDEKGQRLKDTPEWVAFYNARAAITEATQ